jgi:hypothetical protein
VGVEESASETARFFIFQIRVDKVREMLFIAFTELQRLAVAE